MLTNRRKPFFSCCWGNNVRKLIALSLIGMLAACSQSAHDDSANTPEVPTTLVKNGDFNIVLNESGRVGSPAGGTSQLAFASDGSLGTIYVHIGQHVAAGEALASLDARSLSLAASQAAADARAADAQAVAASVDRYSVRLDADRAALERAQRLYDAGVDARKDVEAARATLAADAADARAAVANQSAARAQAQSASAKSAAASNDLSRATLRSPIDGVVIAIARRPGEAVDPTVPVISVGAASQDEATLTVSASDATQIAIGNEVELRSLSAVGHGRVSGVATALDPATQAATVTVTGVPAGVVAGSAVSVRITVGHARGLLVPQAAIVTDPQTGDNTVFVPEKQKDGSTKFVAHKVEIEHEDGTTALLASGVHVGDRVASEGAFELLAPSGS